MQHTNSGGPVGYRRLPDPIVRERAPFVTEIRQTTELSAHICQLVVLGGRPVPLDNVLETIEPRPTMEQLLSAFEIIISDGSSVIVESWRYKNRTATVERCVQRLAAGTKEADSIT